MKLYRSLLTLRHLTKVAPVLGALALVSTASATLLLDPAGGEVTSSLSFGNNSDDAAYSGAYVSITPFFGQSLPLAASGATISVNGHILFGDGDGDGDWDLRNLGVTGPNDTGIARIAPMWADLRIGANSRIIENAPESYDYFAVTWENMESGTHNGYFATFQVILFENATTLHGITFNPGDIAFSYGDVSLYSQLNEIIIGLESGDRAATLPGNETYDGFHSIPGTGAFPVGANEYVHFRPDGSGNYNVTIAPIPEPSATAAVLLGGLLLIGRRQRK